MGKCIDLLDLMRAICRSHVDNEVKFSGGVFDVLPLELLALGVVGPRQTLVHIQSRVEGPGHKQMTML
jgi:hypothetical protein